MKNKIFNLLEKIPGMWSYYYYKNGKMTRILYFWAFDRKWEVWK